MPQNKVTILSTGPLEPSLIEKAAASNIVIDVIPFTDTAPLTENQLRETVIPLITKPAEVIFTSMRAVMSIAPYLNGAAPHWKLHCIGHATRQLAEQYFGEKAIETTADNAGSLAQVIIDSGNTGPFIFFCGSQRRDELPDALQAAGIALQEVVVYQTTYTPQKTETIYDGIVFFSPGAVHSFFSLNAVPPQTKLFSIGPTTKETLEGYTHNAIIESNKPDKRQLIELLIEYFGK